MTWLGSIQQVIITKRTMEFFAHKLGRLLLTKYLVMSTILFTSKMSGFLDLEVAVLVNHLNRKIKW